MNIVLNKRTANSSTSRLLKRKELNLLTYPFFTQKRGQVILQTKHSIGHFNKHYMGMEDFSNFSLKGWKSEPKNYQQHKRT